MSTSPRQTHKVPIVWTNNQSQPIYVQDMRDINLTIVGTGTATILGSADTTIGKKIDFTTTSTLVNSFTPIVIADLGVPSAYATTLVAAGETKIGELNTNLMAWICVTRSSSTLDGFISLCDNS